MSRTVELKSGETLECFIVDEPDDRHVPQVLRLLGHKGGVWQYHMDEWAAGRVKRLETRFYVGRVGEELVGNIMTVVYRGVGIMGHVFTPPEHRKKGICDALMDFHMEDFRRRGGTVLHLNTGFESVAWLIYRAHGYVPMPERPGSMWWAPEEGWRPEGLYANLDRVSVADADWQHWPSMNIFTQMPFDQLVRSASYGLYAIQPSEGQFPGILQDRATRGDVQARVIQTREGHVAGLATLVPERRWGRFAATHVFDLLVHPDAAHAASDLVKDFAWPDAHVLAYAAETDELTIDLLAEAGFHPHSHVERFFRDAVGLVIMDRD